MSPRPPGLWCRIVRGFALGLLLVSAASLAADVPDLTQRVTDLTGTLTTEQRAQLESRSAALEKAKGAQLVVLVVPTTAPEAIEPYALAVAEKNRIGRKGTDDGVLLLVAKDDRKARIEVGYGLEGAIPDVTAHRIIGEYLAPHFRRNDFYGGLDEATQALAKLVEGEALPPPLEAPRARNAPSGGGAIPMGIFAGVVVAFFLRGLGRARGLRMLGGGVLGAVAGWWATAALLGALAAAGAAAFIGLLGIGGGMFAGGHGRHGGWGGGGLGGGWGGGGFGGGGGGWSGGGGGFGGGGASGSW